MRAEVLRALPMRRSIVILLTLWLGGCAASQKDPFEDHMASARQKKDDGRYHEAAAEYREALRIKPSSPEAHNNLGSVLFNLGETDAAILEFQRALLLDSELAAAYNNMGSAQLSKGEAAEAVGSFRRAVMLKPQMSIARFNLCLGLETLGLYAEALLECEKVSVHDPHVAGLDDAIARLKVRTENAE